VVDGTLGLESTDIEDEIGRNLYSARTPAGRAFYGARTITLRAFALINPRSLAASATTATAGDGALSIAVIAFRHCDYFL